MPAPTNPVRTRDSGVAHPYRTSMGSARASKFFIRRFVFGGSRGQSEIAEAVISLTGDSKAIGKRTHDVARSAHKAIAAC